MASRKKVTGSYNRKLLRVNLNTGKCKSQQIPEGLLRNYLGGRGLGVKMLFDELDPKSEPLDSTNMLIFSTGPLTGTNTPTGCRYEVITKSPLTGTITGANAGGYFGTMMKRAGLDVVIINGRAKNPIYLYINNDDYTLINAHKIWGTSTHITTDWIRETEDNKKISVACIGPAGENLAKFACIINDKHRTTGRGGIGAVMGSKKLKAIAVFGTKRIKITNPDKFEKCNKKINDKIKKTTVTNVNLREFGTAKILDSVNDYRLFGTRNFQQNYFEHAKDINAEKLKNTIFKKRNTCYGCPIACKRVTQAGDRKGEGPEFETIWAFGGQCGINDLNAIAHSNYFCNELGLDTISTGNTIGCAMELSERGYIKEKFRFGDKDLIIELTKKIAYREGIGDKLAEGSYQFASGAGHPELSMAVKKLELPAYDPRGATAQGLGYATSTRGACHVRAFVVKSDMVAGPGKLTTRVIKDKVKLVKKTQDLTAVIDSIGVCLFSSFVCSAEDYWVLLEAATSLGLDDSEAMLKVGERIWNLERLFNNAAGLSRKDDTLPKRFATEKVEDSLGYKKVWREKKLIDEYYNQRGWTMEGIPTKAKIAELGI